MKYEKMLKLIKERDDKLIELRRTIEVNAKLLVDHTVSDEMKLIYKRDLRHAIESISSKFDRLEAFRAMIDFNLDELGWIVRDK